MRYGTHTNTIHFIVYTEIIVLSFARIYTGFLVARASVRGVGTTFSVRG